MVIFYDSNELLTLTKYGYGVIIRFEAALIMILLLKEKKNNLEKKNCSFTMYILSRQIFFVCYIQREKPQTSQKSRPTDMVYNDNLGSAQVGL